MKLGEIGENIAANFLDSQNYEIISRNYRSRYGEIDIIGIEKGIDDKLVFIEVKTRSNDHYGSPQSSFSYKKAKSLLKAAQRFILKNKENLPEAWRFDLISIKSKGRSDFQITHVKNIIDGSF